MALTMTDKVLGETFGATSGTALRLKQAAMVVAGIALLTLAAKIKVPMWPVPITMGTFAVLTLGAAYGPRLGLVTILGYMLLGAAGLEVFAASGADAAGLTYMTGGTGGYLVGYVLAVGLLGLAARAGLDRSVGGMVAALIAGNVAIYVPGVLWLGVLYGWDQPIVQWGLTPFLIGDAVKLALAALVIPGAWAVVGRSRP